MRSIQSKVAGQFFVIALAVFVPPTLSSAGEPGAKEALSSDVKQTLAKAFPDMRMVEREDEDSRDPCGGLTAHPGWVAGDFRGEGRTDYAVLLVDPQSKKRGEFNGKPYTVNSFAFIVLLAQPNGKFETAVLDRFDENLPTGKGLMPRESGDVYSLKDYKTIRLQNHAITLFSCKQYAVIYYWDGKQFSNFGTAN